MAATHSLNSTAGVQESRPSTDSDTRSDSGRRRQRGTRENLKVRLGQILLGLALLGAWELAARLKWPDPVLAKSPADSWAYLREAVASGELWVNTRATLIAVLVSWVLAGALGIAAGIALGLLPKIEKIVEPYLDAVNAMPRIALAPLFIVAFGINMSAKVALAVTLVFFIVMSGARAGVRSTDAELMRISIVLGAKKRHLFTKIFLPVATPAIFAALRLGLIYSLLGVVGSELIAARDGLGQLIASYSAIFRIDAVYAILIMLAVVAMVLNRLMGIVERFLLKWQPPVDR